MRANLKFIGYAALGVYAGLQLAKLTAPVPVIRYVERAPEPLQVLASVPVAAPSIPETSPTAESFLNMPRVDFSWIDNLRPEIHYITKYRRHRAGRRGTLRSSTRFHATTTPKRGSASRPHKSSKPRTAIIIHRKAAAYAF